MLKGILSRHKLTIKIQMPEGMADIKAAHPGEWLDLRSSEDIFIKKGTYKRIDLGIALQLPKKYEAILAPRSSTYEKYGIIMTASPSVIDNSYCGPDDHLSCPVYALRDTYIKRNDRICQLRIQRCQPEITLKKVKKLTSRNRGGFGSTGHAG